MRQDQKDDSFNPMYRNTRSRLFKRKRSSEDQERSQSREMPVHTGQHWKQQGNHAFKQHQYDAAIECYSKAIVLPPDSGNKPGGEPVLLEPVEVFPEEGGAGKQSKPP